MNFLVTAGGTTEKIDSVRNITNTATGRLGSLTADALAVRPGCEQIFYICAANSCIPKTAKAAIVPITDTASLETAVRKVLTENKISAIVHSMAVSDYRVKQITRPNGEKILDTNGKINSTEKNILLLLEATPKIISLFPKLSPESIIVGFKLLSGVDKITLIKTAYDFLKNNQCNYIIANDTQDINADKHIAYLIDKQKNITPYNDKQGIANGIAGVLFSELNHCQRLDGRV
ncbi:phosphopantothenate--cysteine ligase [Spirochaetia bacterium]|nr:phosphopantothenate--cysteine ligase [Spirochaetia bacterium]